MGRIRSRLLEWYDAHLQDFPWRTARDPYAALVAAVAAQQTQMSRVLPTYERWMTAFPTLRAAAEADRAAVLRAWGRAGYPRRAVALHETARRCVAQHDGRLPADLDALLALPGVGPFTAAIVLCFGYGIDAPAVDTNIVRVIGRVVFGDLQPAAETPRGAIDAAAARLLRPGTAARWNPALMDYGARVCTPRPKCGECVVASLCAARPRFAAGAVAEPVRAQGRFDGSDRQWRGRLLRVLREADGPLRLGALLKAADVPAEEKPRVRALLGTLCADGLAWSDGGWCGLGSEAQAPAPRRPAR
ncbi:MAG: A/G-specific adenine glycosylase [Dehalococcoidia bacterium]|nr:A/G-specific adenine glycosylase [Dehalococcoidia bacterium]